MHVDKLYLDKRLPQFLFEAKKLVSLQNNVKLTSFKEEWFEEIGSQFSIGGLRQIMRETQGFIQELASESLLAHATNADKACRALSCWPHFDKCTRQNLILTISDSREASVGNHAAYILTRLPQLWEHTMYLWGEYQERSWLISLLVKRKDVENAQNALRWAKQYQFPLHQSELRRLAILALS